MYALPHLTQGADLRSEGYPIPYRRDILHLFYHGHFLLHFFTGISFNLQYPCFHIHIQYVGSLPPYIPLVFHHRIPDTNRHPPCSPALTVNSARKNVTIGLNHSRAYGSHLGSLSISCVKLDSWTLENKVISSAFLTCTCCPYLPSLSK
jgi:hypothetical protein